MGFMALVLLAIFSSFLITVKVMDRVNLRKIELDEWNTLYECLNCGSLHRKYQEEMSIRADRNYTSYLLCPKCYSPVKLYSKEEFDWMKESPIFPRISNRDVRKLKRAIHKLEKYKNMDRSIEHFMQFYHLLPSDEKEKEK